jgi:hypothetical protein
MRELTVVAIASRAIGASKICPLSTDLCNDVDVEVTVDAGGVVF